MTRLLETYTVVDDLAVFLGLDADHLDRARAWLVADLAVMRVATVLDPVPEAARPIVLDVAVRAYVNPEGVDVEQVGQVSRTFRTSGVYLTDRERTDLAALAAGCSGRAFTVTPGPRRPRSAW